VARQGRRTEPLETLHGVVENYAEIEELLSDGEMRGRRWVFDRAQSDQHGGSKPTDHDILDLHRAMFGEFLDWAGTTRRDDRGPGGRVSVPWPDVRIQLKNLGLDLAAWIGDTAMMDTEAVANVIADAHHRFQWIHPFTDTNGRTGRVLDHYLLWVTFGLHSDSLETSPSIEYFPTERHEDEYYEGLLEADLNRPERLRAFFLERLVALFDDS
jgi:fido (protein-threonine AMPylation protein)